MKTKWILTMALTGLLAGAVTGQAQEPDAEAAVQSAADLAETVAGVVSDAAGAVSGAAAEAEDAVSEAADEAAGAVSEALADVASEAGAAGEREIRAIDPTSLLKYEMTEVGSFAEESRLSFMRDAVLTPDGEHYAMLSEQGQPIVNGIDNIEYLGSGLYEVRQPLEEENVNKTGLVTMDGEVLIPCEAASISRPANREGDGVRFLEVIYTTEKTENEDECIIYFTQSMFSLSVGEDDVMYKGYAKVYDVLRKQFVEGVTLDQVSRYGFYDFGDSFTLEHGNTTTMYNADGEQIWETTGLVLGDTYHALTVSTNGKYYIVNGEGKDVFSSDKSLSDVNGALDYYSVADGESGKPYHIIDMQGTQILPDAFGVVYQSSYNDFSVKPDQDSDEEKAIARDGSVIAENVEYNNPMLGGYCYVTIKDQETATLVTPEAYYSGLELWSSQNLAFGKDGAPVILNSGETIAVGADAQVSSIAPGLLKVQESSSSGTSYSLYDLFTGEQLLAGDYLQIEKAGEYVLACTSDSTGKKVWEVYHMNLVSAN